MLPNTLKTTVQVTSNPPPRLVKSIPTETLHHAHPPSCESQHQNDSGGQLSRSKARRRTRRWCRNSSQSVSVFSCLSLSPSVSFFLSYWNTFLMIHDCEGAWTLWPILQSHVYGDTGHGLGSLPPSLSNSWLPPTRWAEEMTFDVNEKWMFDFDGQKDKLSKKLILTKEKCSNPP